MIKQQNTNMIFIQMQTVIESQLDMEPAQLNDYYYYVYILAEN